MTEFNSWDFSSALRHKRNVELRIDIRKAALQIGISAPTLSRVENCKAPDLYTYFYCCKWLGVDMKEFFNLTDNPDLIDTPKRKSNYTNKKKRK